MRTPPHTIASLDRRYCYTLSDVESGEQLQQLRDLAGQSILTPGLWPTLPGSVLFRARAVLQRKPSRTLCVGVVDPGFVALLSRDGDVDVLDPSDNATMDWAKTIERPSNIAVVTTPGGPYDIIVCGVMAPDDHRVNNPLRELCQYLVGGGCLAVQVRFGLDHFAAGQFRRASLETVKSYYDIDHYYIEGPWPIDMAGDFHFLQPREMKSTEAWAPDSIFASALDFYGLAEACREPDSMQRLVELFASVADSEFAHFAVEKTGSFDFAWWFDKSGRGCVFQISQDRRQLTVTLLPYRPRYEHAVCRAVFELFGNETTRMRPMVSKRYGKEMQSENKFAAQLSDHP